MVAQHWRKKSFSSRKEILFFPKTSHFQDDGAKTIFCRCIAQMIDLDRLADSAWREHQQIAFFFEQTPKLGSFHGAAEANHEIPLKFFDRIVIQQICIATILF